MTMVRPIILGTQNFEKLRRNNAFFVDKTDFICEWWKRMSEVTLVTRPRRFGKTLMMDIVGSFFSSAQKNQETLFEGLKVWKDADLRALAGTFPVISLTFSGVKGKNWSEMQNEIAAIISPVYDDWRWLADNERLSRPVRKAIAELSPTEFSPSSLTNSLRVLSGAIWRCTGKNPIILLDEYDAPMIHAWNTGYWSDAVMFMQSFMNYTFKANKNIERGLITGVTRIGKESIFSDLNTPDVITVTSEAYASCFGFTEAEVESALTEYELKNKSEVKAWYDGFTFGSVHDIYNPWSIIKFLQNRKLEPYWVNTGNNLLVGNLVKAAGKDVKSRFEELLNGGLVRTNILEDIVFQDLNKNSEALWTLLASSGYLKIAGAYNDGTYDLALTNLEVKEAFQSLIRHWFDDGDTSYSDFLQALFSRDADEMTASLNELMSAVFSYFDTDATNPERFYHGFVLGLLVTLKGRYIVRSNRESGIGRYDVMLEPVKPREDFGYVLEFKSRRIGAEGTIEQTAESALKQIRDKNYSEELVSRGCDPQRICSIGLAFEGKRAFVKIG